MTNQEKGLKEMFDFIYILNPQARRGHPEHENSGGDISLTA
jgi:hypothetical protein